VKFAFEKESSATSQVQFQIHLTALFSVLKKLLLVANINAAEATIPFKMTLVDKKLFSVYPELDHLKIKDFRKMET
jgi:hypothetical protein